MRHSRIPLGRADMLAATATREAQQMRLPVDDIVLAGGVRRFAPVVDAVSLLAVAPATRHADVLAGFTRLPIVRSVVLQEDAHVRLLTDRGLLDVHVTRPEDAGAAHVWCTGSKAHVASLVKRAAAIGLTFDAGRLLKRDGVLPAPNEPSFYGLLGLPYVPAELREGGDEIDAAERGAIPRLISENDIRGDLHMHSTWSDGRDSILHMVLSARRLGYAYVAITDHSERSWASRKLLAPEVPIQRQEIDTIRRQSPGIEILHGVEVDIMPDGTLDFDDETLASFEIVLASLHDAHGHDADRLTARYLSAMRHPLVNVVTHPANRSPGLSDGYDLDYDRLFEAAIETGTAMEIDGAPGHLDMDGSIARRAAAAGVTIAINSDCHRADALGRQMSFGLGTARRGWVEPHQVLNTREIGEIRDFIARKRGQ